MNLDVYFLLKSSSQILTFKSNWWLVHTSQRFWMKTQEKAKLNIDISTQMEQFSTVVDLLGHGWGRKTVHRLKVDMSSNFQESRWWCQKYLGDNLLDVLRAILTVSKV